MLKKYKKRAKLKSQQQPAQNKKNKVNKNGKEIP